MVRESRQNPKKITFWVGVRTLLSRLRIAPELSRDALLLLGGLKLPPWSLPWSACRLSKERLWFPTSSELPPLAWGASWKRMGRWRAQKEVCQTDMFGSAEAQEPHPGRVGETHQWPHRIERWHNHPLRAHTCQVWYKVWSSGATPWQSGETHQWPHMNRSMARCHGNSHSYNMGRNKHYSKWLHSVQSNNIY